MREHYCSIKEAIDWISQRNDAVVESVHKLMKTLPLSGEPELDKQITAYANGVANWVTASDVWSFEVGDLPLFAIYGLLMINTTHRAKGISGRGGWRYRKVELLSFFQE